MNDQSKGQPNSHIDYVPRSEGEPFGQIRYDDDGILDEIVGTGSFHLERMHDDQWFLDLGGCRLWITTHRTAPVPLITEVERCAPVNSLLLPPKRCTQCGLDILRKEMERRAEKAERMVEAGLSAGEAIKAALEP